MHILEADATAESHFDVVGDEDGYDSGGEKENLKVLAEKFQNQDFEQEENLLKKVGDGEAAECHSFRRLLQWLLSPKQSSSASSPAFCLP